MFDNFRYSRSPSTSCSVHTYRRYTVVEWIAANRPQSHGYLQLDPPVPNDNSFRSKFVRRKIRHAVWLSVSVAVWPARSASSWRSEYERWRFRLAAIYWFASPHQSNWSRFGLECFYGQSSFRYNCGGITILVLIIFILKYDGWWLAKFGRFSKDSTFE